MTLLATIHLGEYAIIAADKKEVALLGDRIVPIHEDAEKIINTGNGIMTGSGYVRLLDKVKNAVTEAEITHTDQILKIIKRERDAEKKALAGHPMLGDVLNTTGWLFTYWTSDPGTLTLRVAMYSPQDEGRIAYITQKNSYIVPPSDMPKQAAFELMDILQNSMMTLEAAPDLEQNLNHNLKCIAQIMYMTSKASNEVSKTFDVGVIFRDGDMLSGSNLSNDDNQVTLKKIGQNAI